MLEAEPARTIAVGQADIVNSPLLLLADEPTGALDSNRWSTREEAAPKLSVL
jgi:ABC-type lipoprotein export system ATPase subunit